MPSGSTEWFICVVSCFESITRWPPNAMTLEIDSGVSTLGNVVVVSHFTQSECLKAAEVCAHFEESRFKYLCFQH